MMPAATELERPEPVMFQVIQGSKRGGQQAAGQGQRSDDFRRLFPISRGKEKQCHQYEKANRQLKNVGRGAFVGWKWLSRRTSEPAKYD